MTDPTSLPNFPPAAGRAPAARPGPRRARRPRPRSPTSTTTATSRSPCSDQQLFVRCSEGDVEIMRVFGQWQIRTTLLADRLHLHCRPATSSPCSMNCVKTGVADDTLVVTGEHLVDARTPTSTALLQVSIQARSSSGVHIWHERMHRARPDAPRATHRRGGAGMSDLVRLEVEDGIGTIRLDRPADERAQRRGPGRPDRAAAAEAAERRDVAAVIVYGGEKVFAAGADIKEMQTMSYTDMVDRSGAAAGAFTARSPASPSRPSPPSPATPSAAGASSRSRCDFRVVGRRRQARPARDPARHHPRSRRHPAARPPRRAVEGQGPRSSRGRFVGADEALRDRAGRRGRRRPPTCYAAARAPASRRTSAARPTPCAPPRRPSTGASRSTSRPAWRSSGCCSPALFATKDREIGMTLVRRERSGQGRVRGALSR